MPRRSEKTLTRKRASAVAWAKSVSERSSNSWRYLAGAMAQSMSMSRLSSRGPNSRMGAISPSMRSAGARPDVRCRSEAFRATISESSRCMASPGSTGSGSVAAGSSTAAGWALDAGTGTGIGGRGRATARAGGRGRAHHGADGAARDVELDLHGAGRGGVGEEGQARAREAGLHLGRHDLREGAHDLRRGERLPDQDPLLAAHREDRAVGGLEEELPAVARGEAFDECVQACHLVHLWRSATRATWARPTSATRSRSRSRKNGSGRFRKSTSRSRDSGAT